MPNFSALLHDGTVAAGVACLLYAATITTTVFTALFTTDATRRRVAQKVLGVLLTHDDRERRAARRRDRDER